jgi:hypothetical protein
MTKQEMIDAMNALNAKLAEMEATEAAEQEEVEDTRPLGEKLGALIGKSAVVAKVQGKSFWSGLKNELVQGGIIAPSKKKK